MCVCVCVCMHVQYTWHSSHMNCAPFWVYRTNAHPPSDQKQSERIPRPRPPAAPTGHRTREAHRRDNHVSTQKTAEESPRQSPHDHWTEASWESGATAHRPQQVPAAQAREEHRTRAAWTRVPNIVGQREPQCLSSHPWWVINHTTKLLPLRKLFSLSICDLRAWCNCFSALETTIKTTKRMHHKHVSSGAWWIPLTSSGSQNLRVT